MNVAHVKIVFEIDGKGERIVEFSTDAACLTSIIGGPLYPGEIDTINEVVKLFRSKKDRYPLPPMPRMPVKHIPDVEDDQ